MIKYVDVLKHYWFKQKKVVTMPHRPILVYHRLQTNSWHNEEETQNTDSHSKIKAKQPSLSLSLSLSLSSCKMIAKLDWTPKPITQSKDTKTHT